MYQKVKYYRGYEHVGYLLSPHQTMKDDMAPKSKQHDDVVSSLIDKLLLPKDVVREARSVMRAHSAHRFRTEYSDSTLKIGKYADHDMWIITRNPMVGAHE